MLNCRALAQLTLLVATEMRLSRAVGLVRSRRYLKVA
jgi:hypothetical protein